MNTCDLDIYTDFPDKIYTTSVSKDEDFCNHIINKSTRIVVTKHWEKFGQTIT